jgi:type IV pilus biogenesis protein CpaD/CtpE
MKISPVYLVWVLLLAAMVMGISGCASTDPDNDSVRPWDAPANGGGMTPIQDQQHPE